jgi:IS1 family transposase
MDEFFESLWPEVKKIIVLCIDHRDAFAKVAKKYWVEVEIWKAHTRWLERFHLTIRTMISRFVRRWIRFSKSLNRQKIVYCHFLYNYNSDL